MNDSWTEWSDRVQKKSVNNLINYPQNVFLTKIKCVTTTHTQKKSTQFPQQRFVSRKCQSMRKEARSGCIMFALSLIRYGYAYEIETGIAP